MRLPEADVEQIVRDLSRFVTGAISVLDCSRHGIDQEDVLQEVYMRILKVIQDNNHGVRYFQAYIKKVINTVYVEELTEVFKNRRARQAYALLVHLHDGINGKGVPYKDVLTNALAESMGELGVTDQAVMELRLAGFTLEEIGRLKHWTYNKTCYTFYRGLKNLKSKLKERGVDYEG